MTIIVTGAAGFIGFHTARALLERGEQVLGIDNFNDYYDPRLKRDRIAQLAAWTSSGAFKLLEADFADRTALDRAIDEAGSGSIIHLGAQPGVRYSITHPAAYISSNLVGHANMLEVARHSGCRHFVYASSSSVYGNSSQVPLRLDARVDHPVSLYAATKKADELMSETYAHLYRLPCTGLRFFTVYGRWGRPDMAVWDFTRRILAGQTIPVFNHGRMRRDFTHVSDIVAGILASLDRPPQDDAAIKPGGSAAPHNIYNLGNSRSEELLGMIELLEQACGRKARLEMLPMQPGEVIETYADITASQRDLGYAPATDIADGLPDFVAWFRSYHEAAAARPSRAASSGSL
jgi:UDP-glucuronate 4-epimerase